MTKEETVHVWDLDHTLMNTERQWFAPVLDDLALAIGRERVFVDEVFARVNTTTFTFPNFFRELGLPEARWRSKQDELMDGLAQRAQGCLYQGVLEVLWQSHSRARPILVTAGDPEWQMWKFGHLFCLHDIFGCEDRHFVPLSGSKAGAVEKYRDASRLVFVDDSPRWHREVAARVPGVKHIRPIWPDTLGTVEHLGDGVEWQVVRSDSELAAALAT